MNPSDLPPVWSELLNGMAEETLTVEQEQQLADLLKTNIEFRQEYVRFCQLLTFLVWRSAAGTGSSNSYSKLARLQDSRKPSHRSLRNWTTVAVVTVVVMVVASLTWVGPRQPEDDSLGTVTQVIGRVGITRGDESPIWIGSPEHSQKSWSFQSGDRIQTEQGSSATITLSDRTEIHIHPETKLELAIRGEPTSQSGLTTTLSFGHLTAKVTPRSSEQVLMFATAQAEVRVLGTELELLADTTHTEVAVLEGRVRVTRALDGDSVDVATSQFLSVAESGGLSVVDFPQTPDEWSEDFESGLPPGWTGRIVRDGLPEKSRGAAGAVPVSNPGGILLEVGSATQNRGLFAWHDDSVLHVTLRIQPPEWFHVYLFTRPYRSPSPTLTWCVASPSLWQTSAGQWRTIHIPLSEFYSITPGLAGPRTLGRIPTRLVFSGQDGPAGVVVDRVWIDRRNTSPDANVFATEQE